MKRLLALLTAAAVVGLGAASPALADSSTRDVTCTSTAYDGYKQVVCQDPDGVTVSDTTYYENGCVTAIDADGNESTTCPEVDPWIDPWTGMHPDDVSCDVEAVTEDSGATSKVVTCRNTDGDIVSQSRYSEDGCVTAIDADGNESTTCPEVDPWIDPENGEYGCFTQTDADGNDVVLCVDPPMPVDITCDSEAGVDGNGVEYKLVTCRAADGTLVSQTRYFPDGCVTQVDADGNEVTDCPTVEPWLPPISDTTCASEPWFDEEGAEYTLVTCTDAEGNVVSKWRYAKDGCATEIGADGNEYTYCKDGSGCTWAPDAEGNVQQWCPGLNYADFYYTLPEGTSVTSVTVGDDGCRLITLSDESTVTACPDPNASSSVTPVTLDERGCIVYAGDDGVIWGTDCPGACHFSTASDDGSGNEMATCYGGNTPDNMEQRTLSLCDVDQLLVDGKVLTLATCDDGCTLVNGLPKGSCTDGWLHSWAVGPRSALWVSASRTWELTCWQREPGAEWAAVDCPKVLYNTMPADGDGRVYKLGTLTGDQTWDKRGNGVELVSLASQTSDGAETPARSVTQPELDTPGSVETGQAVAGGESEALAVAPAVGGNGTTIAALPAAATTPSTPVTPAVAAMALGVAGLAGAASMGVRRVRAPIRRR